MAKNDYFVLKCRILAYLYECLKSSEKPNIEYFKPQTNEFPVDKMYLDYIFSNMLDSGYIAGITKIPILNSGMVVRLTENIQITPKGIEFLSENNMMSKAKTFLKELKEVVPGI